MNAKVSFLSVLRYVFMDFVRDRFGLVLTIMMPVIMIISGAIPGFLASSEASKARIILVGAETAAPKFVQFAESLKANKRFRTEMSDETSARAQLKARKADSLILLPQAEDQRLSVVNAGLKGLSRGELLNAMIAGSGAQIDPALEPEFRTLEDNPRSPLLEFLPVFLMFPLVMQCMVGITSSVVAAKEKGVLRHLALTPVTMARFVLASLIVRGGAGVVQVILILAPLVGFHLIALNLELLLTIGFSALFICSISGIAFLLAGLLPTVNVASQITSAIAVAMFYLSGGLPGTDRIAAIDMVAPLLPIRYFTDSVGQLLLSQTGRLPLVVNAAALIGFTLVLVAITARTFRIESNKK